MFHIFSFKCLTPQAFDCGQAVSVNNKILKFVVVLKISLEIEVYVKNRGAVSQTGNPRVIRIFSEERSSRYFVLAL